MAWGILLYEQLGKHYSLIVADDKLYGSSVTTLEKLQGGILGGKKGIRNEDIDAVCSRINTLKNRLDKGESVNLESELQQVFQSTTK
jgi:hypothetical protein